MRYADELDEQLRDLSQVMPSHRGPAGGRGRIRYAFGGVPPRAEPWAAAARPAPHADVWVLVCGGIAAAVAFAAAFVASGGVAAHASTPPTAVHSVVVQACPTAVPGR
jgi:hypothetical protein